MSLVLTFRMLGVIALSAIGLLAGAIGAGAATNAWQPSSDTNDWYGDTNSWSLTHFPEAGEDVVIANAGIGVLLTNAAPASGWLSSLTVSNTAMLIFTNWDTTLRATNIWVLNKGKITCTGPFTTNDGATNRVYLICSNLFVGTNASIDVERMGYAGGGTMPGYGPGGGTAGRGGGYGGLGGAAGGLPYGSVTNPVDPGSGGGCGDASITGGSGGGAIRVEATGAVVVNGTVTASAGQQAAYNSRAFGSGGSIFILCNTFAGTNGVVRADGGDPQGGQNGGGGGGRIAIIYDTNAQASLSMPSVQFSALGKNNGDIGSIHFPDTRFVTSVFSSNGIHYGQLYIPGFTNWAPGSLTLSNAWIRFLQDSFQLTVAGDLTINGSLARLGIGGSVVTNISATVRPVATGARSALNVGGSLVLVNSGCLYVYSAPTNASQPDYGALVSVTNDLLIQSAGSWIYLYSNPTNGGSPLLRMSNLVIAVAGAGLDADGKGYAGGGPTLGYGPTGSGGAKGAGYGGFGGQRGTLSCGSVAAPLDPGSGGGRGDTTNNYGTYGGGLVRVEAANAVLVNGTITANGQRYVGSSSGVGAGGAIYITCRTFAGTNGIVRADGGGPQQNQSGGGGRISVIYDTGLQAALPVPAVTFSAFSPSLSGGIGGGDLGTLYFSDTRFLTEFIGANTIQHGQLMVPGFASWSPNSLVVSNGWIRFWTNGFQLSVTGDVQVMGSIGRLDLGGDTISTNNMDFYHVYSQNLGPTMNVGGNLVLTNGGCLAVYAGATNGVAPPYGALVHVTQNVSLYSNSWIYPYSNPTNGGSVLFEMANLRILASNAGINANSKGYASVYGSGRAYGPGAGSGATKGAGYGGYGGLYAVNSGQTYGSSNAPVDPGSGGGPHNSGYVGGSGGGLVWIQASGAVTVDGMITANGNPTESGTYGSGGSGGGIYISCRTFTATTNEVIQANGGLGNRSDGGGGGGGRIAIWRTRDRSEVFTNVLVTTNLAKNLGTTGTVFWGWIPEAGTVFVVR